MTDAVSNKISFHYILTYVNLENITNIIILKQMALVLGVSLTYKLTQVIFMRADT